MFACCTCSLFSFNSQYCWTLASCKKTAGQNTALTDCVPSTNDVIVIKIPVYVPIKFPTKRIFPNFIFWKLTEWCRFVTYLWNDPRNSTILCVVQIQFKIIDLGMGRRLVSDKVVSDDIVGTNGYHAPEVLFDDSYDIRADIFMLGITFCVMVWWTSFYFTEVKTLWRVSLTDFGFY